MRQAFHHVFNNVVDGGGGHVCRDGFTFAVDVGDLGYRRGNCGEVEKDACAKGAAQDFDAEKQLGTESGADGEIDAVDATGKRQRSDFRVGAYVQG